MSLEHFQQIHTPLAAHQLLVNNGGFHPNLRINKLDIHCIATCKIPYSFTKPPISLPIALRLGSLVRN
ncbi:hypothetical protein L2E82_32801 [Cichorium intybus]|uniref:Uncharacterized protein n=1 Tax=Cichorium intybus TaxID=13427 RepID=A0ACB9BI46_CICIN|nr:hypothetical protein L2E82_32801 [Cichorium intybus]